MHDWPSQCLTQSAKDWICLVKRRKTSDVVYWKLTQRSRFILSRAYGSRLACQHFEVHVTVTRSAVNQGRKELCKGMFTGVLSLFPPLVSFVFVFFVNFSPALYYLNAWNRLWFSLPYIRPDQKFDTLFQTWSPGARVVIGARDKLLRHIHGSWRKH